MLVRLDEAAAVGSTRRNGTPCARITYTIIRMFCIWSDVLNVTTRLVELDANFRCGFSGRFGPKSRRTADIIDLNNVRY